MNTQNIKKFAFGLVVAAGLTVTTMSTAQAQDWNRRGSGRQVQQQNVGNGQVDSNGNIDRNRNGIDDRYETRDGRVDINQNGIADQDEQNGRFVNPSRNGNRAYGNANYQFNNAAAQQGYRDGLSRGQDDFRNHRKLTPNNFVQFRNGDAAYRDAFNRGYTEGCR